MLRAMFLSCWASASAALARPLKWPVLGGFF
jgi:hypothetical protein